MDNDKPMCLCCGYPVDHEGTKLCEYCYFRSGHGTAKYIVLKAILDNGNVPISINEILEKVNEFRKSMHIKPVGYEAVRIILRRYSKFYEQAKKRGSGYLLIVGTRKVKGSKKPLKTYKLSKNLVKRMGEYEKRWKFGQLLNIRIKKGKKWRRKADHPARARAIYLRVRKGEIGIYDFMLWEQKTTKAISAKVDYSVSQ